MAPFIVWNFDSNDSQTPENKHSSFKSFFRWRKSPLRAESSHSEAENGANILLMRAHLKMCLCGKFQVNNIKAVTPGLKIQGTDSESGFSASVIIRVKYKHTQMRWSETRGSGLFRSVNVETDEDKASLPLCSSDMQTCDWASWETVLQWRQRNVKTLVRLSVCVCTQGNLGVVETLNKSLKETHHLFLLSVRRCDSVPQTEHTHKQTHYAVSFTAKQCGKASEIRGPSFEGSSKNKTDVYGIFLRGGGQIQFNCRSKTTVSLS